MININSTNISYCLINGIANTDLPKYTAKTLLNIIIYNEKGAPVFTVLMIYFERKKNEWTRQFWFLGGHLFYWISIVQSDPKRNCCVTPACFKWKSSRFISFFASTWSFFLIRILYLFSYVSKLFPYVVHMLFYY